MNKKNLYTWILAIIVTPLVAFGDVQFSEIGQIHGIGAYDQEIGKGGGIAAADFDDDGDIDLFIPSAAGVPDKLYRNLGNGMYEEIAVAAGVGSTASSRIALWFDYDGDHLLDLVVTTDCRHDPLQCTTTERVRLYRQVSNALFTDVTSSSGLTNLFPEIPDSHAAGVTAGDVNGDGYLDLLISEWSGPARLMLNDGAGAFTNASISSGITQLDLGHWQAMMHDFDYDGDLDIYAAVDFEPNQLWINNGSGVFSDQAMAAGLNNEMNDMGMSLADWDNDGDLDVYVTNIAFDDRHNVLLRNDSTPGTLLFTEISVAAGVEDGGWGWGTTAIDADNDGWLDLAETNGFNQPGFLTDTSRFFHGSSSSPMTFSNLSTISGFNDHFWGSSLVTFDHDRDGDLDLFQACAAGGPAPADLRLMDNQSTLAGIHNYLVVQPRMAGPNHRAIGAIVRIDTGSLQMMRLISAGTSFMGQEPAEAFFGLGTALNVNQVTVEWPDGTTTVRNNVQPNQQLLITTGPDADSDGVADFADPDDDNDGVDDVADCLPLDAQAWNLPGEAVALLMSESNPATIVWSAPIAAGATTWTYDTIATAMADDFFATAVCLESGGSDTQSIDTDPAAPGSIRYYLARTRNACGVGDGGTMTPEAPRSVRDCP